MFLVSLVQQKRPLEVFFWYKNFQEFPGLCENDPEIQITLKIKSPSFTLLIEKILSYQCLHYVCWVVGKIRGHGIVTMQSLAISNHAFSSWKIYTYTYTYKNLHISKIVIVIFFTKCWQNYSNMYAFRKSMSPQFFFILYLFLWY